MTDQITTDSTVVVGWTSIWVTGLLSAAQLVVFYAFFLCQRRREERNQSYDLYECRQHAQKHRSPPPFQRNWILQAWRVDDDETLRCVGLDAFMFLRFLRMGARITAFGTILSIGLIPIYATGNADGNSTEGFNQLTLARVESGSARLAATVAAWYIFIAFVLYELNESWKVFAQYRRSFLAKGDVDAPLEYRYAIRCEQVPEQLQNGRMLTKYFNRIFPGKVASTVVIMNVSKLDSLVQERDTIIRQLEVADAYVHAEPIMKRPQVTVGGALGLLGGEKKDAIEYYESELVRLNRQIDYERALIPAVAARIRRQLNYGPTRTNLLEGIKESIIGGFSQTAVESRTEVEIGNSAQTASTSSKGLDSPTPPSMNSPLLENAADSSLSPQKGQMGEQPTLLESVSAIFRRDLSFSMSEEEEFEPEEDPERIKVKDTDIIESRITPSSTAFVSFTSLRAKQTAVQCELTGQQTSMRVFPAPVPSSIVWENIGNPLALEEALKFNMKILWTVLILFWAVPVSFVNSLANLDSILQALGIQNVDETSALYGLISGLLPVIALLGFMELLYLAIVTVGKKIVKYKSMPEIDAYATYWHQLFQFANLWFIIIGGSFFNQIDAIMKDPTSIIRIIAHAMPGASVFFVNMILTQSLGRYGLEISMLPRYAIKLIMQMIRPEKKCSQRQIDEAKKPPFFKWGHEIPKSIFIYMVVILYFPIVPIMEAFGLVYFSGMYFVYKHQFLHVYAQEYEGGGNATWLSIFSFIMTSLYMSEAVFIAYMGLKASPVSAALGFVPLFATFAMHRYLRTHTIKFLQILSLQTSATIDIKEGERSQSDFDDSHYAQPAVNPKADESPLPYRHDTVELSS